MEDYNNNELDLKFVNLLDHMKGFETAVTSSLVRIEGQTTKTNGHVADAQREIAKLKQWQSWMVGFGACLSIILLSIIVPLVIVLAPIVFHK